MFISAFCQGFFFLVRGQAGGGIERTEGGKRLLSLSSDVNRGGGGQRM